MWDVNQNRHRSAAEDIKVDFYGNGKFVPVRLELGDTIQRIDGQAVRSVDDLAVALNSAANPHHVSITFRDHRSGRVYNGYLNAVRTK